MKKLLLLLFVCVVSWHATAQSCTAPIFTNQQQLSDFKTQNPSCKTISGDLNINGSGITNLNALSDITVINGNVTISNSSLINLSGLGALISVEGRLTIIDNPVLANVSGLENLTSLSNGINVENNKALTELSGLQSLSYVGSYLRVVYNAALTSIEAFNKITSVSDFLSVGANPLLESLSGLRNITSAHEVSIAQNIKLLNLDGLKSLTTTTGYVYVGFNPKITNLQGLNNLKQIEGYLNITDNTELISLEGLDALESVRSNIQIQNNGKLSTCAVSAVCAALRANPTSVYASSNGPDCNSATEIAVVCASLPVELVSFSGIGKAEGNILKWTTASEINNKGFEIERSLNSRSFETIGFVEGNTDTNQQQNYSFTDAAPHSLTYYRLKQIDWDGTSAYSKIIAVKEEREIVTVYPNPSHGRLFIGAKNRNQPYHIKNSQGVTVKASSMIPENGITTASLQNGLYFVTVGPEVFKVLVNNE